MSDTPQAVQTKIRENLKNKCKENTDFIDWMTDYKNEVSKFDLSNYLQSKERN